MGWYTKYTSGTYLHFAVIRCHPGETLVPDGVWLNSILGSEYRGHTSLAHPWSHAIYQPPSP